MYAFQMSARNNYWKASMGLRGATNHSLRIRGELHWPTTTALVLDGVGIATADVAPRARAAAMSFVRNFILDGRVIRYGLVERSGLW